MRIETNPWNALDPVNGRDEGRTRGSGMDGSSRTGELESEISEEAQLGTRLMRQFAAIPEVREERVMQLRTAVQSGSYSVTSEQIADAMVRDALPGWKH